LVREWISGLDSDEPLFPKLARRKTYTMVQKDLERAGIPYETPEGLANFHADIRQTAKYTHIGIEDQAEALAGLPRTKVSADSDRLHIACIPGGVQSREVSADGSEFEGEAGTENEKTPSGEGVSSLGVTDFQEESVDVSSGGGGNCTRVPRSFNDGLYVCSRSFNCRPQTPERQGVLWLIPS